MNTGQESGDKKTGDLDKIVVETASPSDLQVQRIEESLQGERHGRNRERFIGLVIIIILLDMVAFEKLGAFGEILIFILELIAILVTAELCGIDGIYPIIQNAIDAAMHIRRDGH